MNFSLSGTVLVTALYRSQAMLYGEGDRMKIPAALQYDRGVPATGEARSLGPFAWYYLATPVFVLTDVVWGINIRIMALDHLSLLKYVYYALCLGCGVLAAARPSLAPVVAQGESSVNLGLVVITIPVAYIRVLDSIVGGKDAINPFTPLFFVNFALSAVVAYTAHVRHQIRRA